jgi:hypothetical protein
MIGQMRGDDYRKALENSGLLVFTDGPHRFVVRLPDATDIARYELYEDGPFRWGWIQTADGHGRIDCTSWIEFSTELAEEQQR